MTQETLILGGGAAGLELATTLEARGQPVTLIEDDLMVQRARAGGLSAHESTLENPTAIEQRSAATVIVATPCDARNLLLAGAAPSRFDADRVVALVNDPDNEAAFEDAGIETICVATTLAGATADAVDRTEQPTVSLSS